MFTFQVSFKDGFVVRTEIVDLFSVSGICREEAGNPEFPGFHFCNEDRRFLATFYVHEIEAPKQFLCSTSDQETFSITRPPG